MLLQFYWLWTYSDPLSLLASLAVATWRLKLNGENWRSIGLKHDVSHLNLFLWTLGALIITILMGNIAGEIASSIITKPESLSKELTTYTQNRFAYIPGNLSLYLMWVAMSWIIGGLTEELLFRGFLISRFESLLSKLSLAIVYAIIIQAIIFGQQHMYYQGVIGFVEVGIIGVVSGVIYVLCKRRL